MASAGVQVSGIDEVNARIAELGRAMKRRSASRVLRKALAPMQAAAEARTPVRTGKLKESWKIRILYDAKGQATAYLGAHWFVALFIEYGHKIEVGDRRKSAKRFTLIGRSTSKTVGFRAARPMLRPAFDQCAELAVQIATAEMSKALDGAIRYDKGQARKGGKR